MRLGRHVADGGQDDVGVLAGAPVHLAAERHADRVGRDELDDRGAVLVVYAAVGSIVPDYACSAQDTIERPDDQCRPEVATIAAKVVIVSVKVALTQTDPACNGDLRDLLDFPSMEIAAEDENPNVSVSNEQGNDVHKAYPTRKIWDMRKNSKNTIRMKRTDITLNRVNAVREAAPQRIQAWPKSCHSVRLKGMSMSGRLQYQIDGYDVPCEGSSERMDPE